MKKIDKQLSQGFSLIELLVVLVILGMLGGLVGPRLFDQVDNSSVKIAQNQVRMLKSALQTYRLDVGRFPSTSEGLDSLITKPSGLERWRGPYLDDLLPMDPWGVPFVYVDRADNFQGFALYSRGADKVDGGEGLDADVGFVP